MKIKFQKAIIKRMEIHNMTVFSQENAIFKNKNKKQISLFKILIFKIKNARFIV